MKATDWSMIGYLGIGLSFFFFAIGGWIWLNVSGYVGLRGWLQYFEYRGYPVPLFIIGFVFLVSGLVFIWRASEERKFETETKPISISLKKKPVSNSLKKCPKCGIKFSGHDSCPYCKVKLEST